MKIFAYRNIQIIIVGVTEVLYALIFVKTYPQVGMAAAMGNVIPAMLLGWFFGTLGGLYFSLIALPVNFLLFHLVGDVAFNQIIPNLISCAAVTLVSVIVGWIRDLNERVRKQADALQAERFRLKEEIIRRTRAEERLSYEALHDPLTNLPNRRLFYNRLEHALAWNKRFPNSVCAVLYLDLNWFKKINDNYGHNTGDQLLTRVAERLKSSVRDLDTVARMGGDEFAILIEAVSTPEDVIAIIERIQVNLAVPYELESAKIVNSASIGAVIGLSAYEGTDRIVNDADTAMFHAKANRNSDYKVFEIAMCKQQMPNV
ncbi:MAG: GGDEF domain-containing protein [Anaerolineaceae bacterium]|nr:GGDEF domain-containing protein [Anaerolineaceae bacterium]